ncbi:iron-containing alcohol dehydrogenase [Angelakisella massiliensis]|uniref:iron-containing alcohol dehydrogenase n=1 Tax=Angelakisella massiliensis TaxID=1871018 RepID=UPI0024B14B17|nr:iron-containing alcohol dehydrogenase [Angelakisella massiliensis]
MKNFLYDIGTKIYFGEGQIVHLPEAIKPYAQKVLLVYGGGSIKKSGLYDTVTRLFRENGIQWQELPGVEPNPRITSVNAGARLCREHGLEGVVAVGGGSTIDCSKAIAEAAAYDGDAWDLVLKKAPITKVLPVFSVLTLAATGSEMDCGAVISNMDTNDKLVITHPDARSKASILDPTYTYTVSAYQTAAGTADIMSHILETYFSRVGTAGLQDRMAEALLKTCIQYGPIACNDPANYEARANLMWTSSLAINGLLSLGKGTPWSAHSMEHELSAYFDITHGVGLAILTPAWMRYVLDDSSVDKFAEYAFNVWNIPMSDDRYAMAREAIDRTQQFFTKELKIAAALREVGITEDKLEIMAEKAARTLGSAYKPLAKEDVLAIYRACF